MSRAPWPPETWRPASRRLRRPTLRPSRALAGMAAVLMAGSLATAALTPAVAAAKAAQAPAKAKAGADPSGWQRKTSPLSTPWTNQVSPTNALPEYPRPQMTRAQWRNLNGVWQFEGTSALGRPPIGQDLSERILVPYPVESALSGIQRHESAMWYRRTVDVPKSWKVGQHDRRLLLHFGAVDYQSVVYVNGLKVATHKGGYDAFSADITGAVRSKGPQEILVGVTDPTDAGGQPVGKQRLRNGGIFYTPTSGIWQTVWLEPTAFAHVDRLDMTPDVRTRTLSVVPQTTGATGTTVQAIAYDTRGRVVGQAAGAAGTRLRIAVPNAHLWSPTDPYLYTLKVRVLDGRKVLDSVGSYFGMRSIALGQGPDGKTRMLLNGKFVFQTGPLDQGFWPDGIYTAPTDAALKFDLQQEKSLGFNMVRKHIKVEPDRWYYWADKLGLLVWQDMPAMTTDRTPDAAAQANFKSELHRMIELHKSWTSIVTWVPFNEGWGEWDKTATGQIADQIKQWDPSRLVDTESGINCCNSKGDSGKGDIYDDHTYVGPGTPAAHPGRATVDGEYGGLGLHTPGHEFDPSHSFAYELEPDSATLTRRYVETQQRLLQVEKQCALSAGVYTQTTDVEDEINGLYTYDRQVLKMDGPQVRAANQALVKASSDIGAPPTFPPGTPGTQGIDAYPMNEGSGTTVKDTVGSHDATAVNGPTWTTGHEGSALHFDGVNDYADTGAALLDTAGNYSVSAWVKLDSAGDGFATAVSQDGTSNSAFFLQYSGADHVFAFSFAGTRALAPVAPETGRWYHLVGVRDAANQQLKLYVDGKLAGTQAVCLGDASTGHTVIGRGQFGGKPVDYWRGAVDDVHVFDRALTDADVAKLYPQAG